MKRALWMESEEYTVYRKYFSYKNFSFSLNDSDEGWTILTCWGHMRGEHLIVSISKEGIIVNAGIELCDEDVISISESMEGKDVKQENTWEELRKQYDLTSILIRD